MATTSLLTVSALCAAATAAGFAGAWWWRFDLCAHFRLQYAVVFATCATGLAALRRWRTAGACALGLGVNLTLIAPLWLTTPRPAAADAAPVRVVSFNLNYHNTRYDEVAAYLRDVDPDVAILIEVTPQWLAALEGALPEYDVFAEPQRYAFGIAALVRAGAGNGRVLDLGGLPALEVRVGDGPDAMAILGIHTMPPVSRETSGLRDALLRAAADWANAEAGPTAIVGDFNATPWSHPFRELLATADLVNSQRGVAPTWPRDLWPLSIPIDHCVHSRNLTASARRLGPHLGSDHRPLEVVLARASR